MLCSQARTCLGSQPPSASPFGCDLHKVHGSQGTACIGRIGQWGRRSLQRLVWDQPTACGAGPHQSDNPQPGVVQVSSEPEGHLRCVPSSSNYSCLPAVGQSALAFAESGISIAKDTTERNQTWVSGQRLNASTRGALTVHINTHDTAAGVRVAMVPASVGHHQLDFAVGW